MDNFVLGWINHRYAERVKIALITIAIACFLSGGFLGMVPENNPSATFLEPYKPWSWHLILFGVSSYMKGSIISFLQKMTPIRDKKPT